MFCSFMNNFKTKTCFPERRTHSSVNLTWFALFSQQKKKKKMMTDLYLSLKYLFGFLPLWIAWKQISLWVYNNFCNKSIPNNAEFILQLWRKNFAFQKKKNNLLNDCYIIAEGFFYIIIFRWLYLIFRFRLRNIRLRVRVVAHIKRWCSRSRGDDVTITDVIIKPPDRKWDLGCEWCHARKRWAGILGDFEKK